ncbi:MAG: right-handed parallel beta-helix repeat-containing protein [Ignavibacteriales bacterium]|nr:right-handed parallel beta-helix repeat-containing protein [Ignavibacteriales bacterium]
MKKNFLPFVILIAGIFQISLFSQASSVSLLSGTGTLISSHASITEAYGAITTPMTQGYTIELTGTYTGANETFPITLTQKAGIDSLKRITIRPALGVGLITISSLQASLPVILFDGGDFISIDGRAGGTGSSINLFIENTTLSGANTTTINFLNGATYNELRYVHAKNNLQGSAGPRVILFSTAANNPEGNSYNKVSNCKIEGSRTGIASSGTVTVFNRYLVIEENEIVNWGYAGIWLLSACSDVVVRNNRIYQTQGYNNTIVSGIITGAVVGQSLTISGNRIYGMNGSSTSSTQIRGIAITPGRGATYNIFNNFIALDQNGLSNVRACFGALVSGTVPFTFSFDFNSVNISGTHSGGTAGQVISAAFVKTATNDTSVFKVRNNLLVNSRIGGPAGAFHTGSFIAPNGVVEMNYNVSYSTGSADNYHAGWNGTLYNDLALYKTAATPHEVNTIFKNIAFASATDLHLIAPSDGDVDLAGIPIPGITTDIDYTIRSGSAPYRGADEAAPLIPVELASFSSSVNENNVVLTWTTASEKNNYGFEVERSSGKTDWTNAGFVKGFGTTAEGKEYSFTDQKLPSGRYSYRLKQIDFDGTVEYHALSNEVNVGLPESFSISQNYPNPFNPSTRIDFTVADASGIVIELFDITGGKIAEIVNSSFEPGFYSVVIDAQKYKLSSGTFIFRFSAKDGSNNSLYTATKKMTILK